MDFFRTYFWWRKIDVDATYFFEEWKIDTVLILPRFLEWHKIVVVLITPFDKFQNIKNEMIYVTK